MIWPPLPVTFQPHSLPSIPPTCRLLPFSGPLSFFFPVLGLWGFPGGSVVKNLPAVQEPMETWVWSLGQEDTLEEGMATHSSILAWRTSGKGESGGLWGCRESDMTGAAWHILGLFFSRVSAALFAPLRLLLECHFLRRFFLGHPDK